MFNIPLPSVLKVVQERSRVSPASRGRVPPPHNFFKFIFDLKMASFDAFLVVFFAFIASRVDYCNTVLAGSPRFISDRLQRVLNAAARGTRKFDRGLSDLLHSELHWLDIYQRVQYKL